MRWSRPWRKCLWVALGIVVGCSTIVLSCGGSVVVSLTDWADEEVRFSGAAWTNDDARDLFAMLSIKNIVGLEDGDYELVPPSCWQVARRGTTIPSIVNASSSEKLDIVDTRRGRPLGSWDADGAGSIVALPPSRARGSVSSCFDGPMWYDDDVKGRLRLGVTVTADTDRVYTVLLWGEDLERDSWINLGCRQLGRGTQSAQRPTIARALTPVGRVIDVIGQPLCYVVFFVLTALGVLRPNI